MQTFGENDHFAAAPSGLSGNQAVAEDINLVPHSPHIRSSAGDSSVDDTLPSTYLFIQSSSPVVRAAEAGSVVISSTKVASCAQTCSLPKRPYNVETELTSPIVSILKYNRQKRQFLVSL